MEGKDDTSSRFSDSSVKYLYADYTPFDGNRNFITTLRDFVSLTSSIVKLHQSANQLSIVIKEAELLREDIKTKFGQFGSSCSVAIDNFIARHNEQTHPELQRRDSDLLLETKDSFIEMLNSTEKRFTEQYQRYIININSKITNIHSNAIDILGSWLLKSYRYDILGQENSNIFDVLQIRPDNNSSRENNRYIISYTHSLIIPTGKKDSSNNHSLTYTFSVDSANVDFWNHKRRVSDIVSDLRIPIGMKVPLSEKVRKSFSFVRGAETKDRIEKEPQFIHLDDYYVASVRLEANDTLSVILASDFYNLNRDIVRINFNRENIHETESQESNEPKVPRIDYISKDGEIISNIFQIEEVAPYADIQKVMLLGKIISDKTRRLLKENSIISHSRLESIKLDSKDVVISDTEVRYETDQVKAMLEYIATGFAPIVQKIKEKSPVKDELILREQVTETDRVEHVLKIDEIYSNLSISEDSKKIANLLLSGSRAAPKDSGTRTEGKSPAAA